MKLFFGKNYETFIKAGIITIGLVLVFNRFGMINHSNIGLNVFGFFLSCFLISFLIDKFRIYKILGVVIGLLVVSVVVEQKSDIWTNPITVPLVVLFWVGVTYLILPEFFKKYRIAIFSIYLLVIGYFYFFAFRINPDDAEMHRLNFLNFMGIPIPFFASLWLYEQWRWLKILKADKAKAELALLKSQINPHFFFNTLNNLYGLVVEKSPQAPEVVLKLSDMMRYTIYEGKEDAVKLSDEIRYLETYIELHKIRYQKKVDVRFTHQLEKEVFVAPLLFIILLENAIKHGVESLTENAYIYLDLKTTDNQISFTIENNYEGNSSNKKAGIGLDNLKKRLAHIYPNQHELVFEQTDSTYAAHLNLSLNPDLQS